MFRWLADQITGWFGAFFELLRSFGDSAIASMKTAALAAVPSMSGPWVDLQINRANGFFPLSETVSLMTVYLGLWALVWAYKFIKSWIPTVAS